MHLSLPSDCSDDWSESDNVTESPLPELGPPPSPPTLLSSSSHRREVHIPGDLVFNPSPSALNFAFTLGGEEVGGDVSGGEGASDASSGYTSSFCSSASESDEEGELETSDAEASREADTSESESGTETSDAEASREADTSDSESESESESESGTETSDSEASSAWESEDETDPSPFASSYAELLHKAGLARKAAQHKHDVVSTRVLGFFSAAQFIFQQQLAELKHNHREFVARGLRELADDVVPMRQRITKTLAVAEELEERAAMCADLKRKLDGATLRRNQALLERRLKAQAMDRSAAVRVRRGAEKTHAFPQGIAKRTMVAVARAFFLHERVEKARAMSSTVPSAGSSSSPSPHAGRAAIEDKIAAARKRRRTILHARFPLGATNTRLLNAALRREETQGRAVHAFMDGEMRRGTADGRHATLLNFIATRASTRRCHRAARVYKKRKHAWRVAVLDHTLKKQQEDAAAADRADALERRVECARRHLWRAQDADLARRGHANARDTRAMRARIARLVAFDRVQEATFMRADEAKIHNTHVARVCDVARARKHVVEELRAIYGLGAVSPTLPVAFLPRVGGVGRGSLALGSLELVPPTLDLSFPPARRASLAPTFYPTYTQPPGTSSLEPLTAPGVQTFPETSFAGGNLVFDAGGEIDSCKRVRITVPPSPGAPPPNCSLRWTPDVDVRAEAPTAHKTPAVRAHCGDFFHRPALSINAGGKVPALSVFDGSPPGSLAPPDLESGPDAFGTWFKCEGAHLDTLQPFKPFNNTNFGKTVFVNLPRFSNGPVWESYKMPDLGRVSPQRSCTPDSLPSLISDTNASDLGFSSSGSGVDSVCPYSSGSQLPDDRATQAAVRVQSALRGCIARMNLADRAYGATMIQALWRGYALRSRLYLTPEEAAVMIQTTWRGFRARSFFQEHHETDSILDELDEEARAEIRKRRDKCTVM